MTEDNTEETKNTGTKSLAAAEPNMKEEKAVGPGNNGKYFLPIVVFIAFLTIWTGGLTYKTLTVQRDSITMSKIVTVDIRRVLDGVLKEDIKMALAPGGGNREDLAVKYENVSRDINSAISNYERNGYLVVDIDVVVAGEVKDITPNITASIKQKYSPSVDPTK